MPRNGDNQKQRAHELVDRLAPNQASALVDLLEVMLDPVSRAMASAPMDDEPESEAERQAVAESKAWYEQHGGKGIPHKQVQSELTTTPKIKNRVRGKQRA